MTNEPENQQLPDWIARRQQQKAEQDRRDDEVLQRQLEASKRVANEGPDFWNKFTTHLKVNAESLPALGEELVGGASLMNGNVTQSPELQCHIEVRRQSVSHVPEISQMNLWYQPGGSRIRCWYQNQKQADIVLQLGHNGVAAIIGNEMPMTAEQLAEHIVKWMADQVRYVQRRSYRISSL